MEVLCRLVQSSIGKKIMAAAGGLLLCGFLVSHLAGNLLMYMPDAGASFNHYAETLEHNPLLPIAELALLGIFLLHIATSLWLKLQNWQARPVGYAIKTSKGGSTWGSSSMIYTAALILVFLVVHIKTFKFGGGHENVFRHVMGWFSNPAYALFYVAAMLALGLHLSHGFQSAFQTFGIQHPKYTPLVKLAGWGFAALVTIGFGSFPVWAGFLGGGTP